MQVFGVATALLTRGLLVDKLEVSGVVLILISELDRTVLVVLASVPGEGDVGDIGDMRLLNPLPGVMVLPPLDALSFGLGETRELV